MEPDKASLLAIKESNYWKPFQANWEGLHFHSSALMNLMHELRSSLVSFLQTSKPKYPWSILISNFNFCLNFESILLLTFVDDTTKVERTICWNFLFFLERVIHMSLWLLVWVKKPRERAFFSWLIWENSLGAFKRPLRFLYATTPTSDPNTAKRR